jgi:hypothetical protein
MTPSTSQTSDKHETITILISLPVGIVKFVAPSKAKSYLTILILMV